MIEKELIGKIKELRQIKPNQDWVFLTKNRILGETVGFGKKQAIADFLPEHKWTLSLLQVLRGFALKPAYAGALAVFILFGLFGFAQNSMPGDYLYPLKKITERSQMFFASEEERQQISFELAQKRLEELVKIVEENQVQKLAPAINEFQASVSRIGTVRDKEEARKVVEISKTAREISKTYGVAGLEEVLQRPEMESLIIVFLEYLIPDLENSSLTIKQEVVLDRMKEYVDEGKYFEALELFGREW